MAIFFVLWMEVWGSEGRRRLGFLGCFSFLMCFWSEGDLRCLHAVDIAINCAGRETCAGAGRFTSRAGRVVSPLSHGRYFWCLSFLGDSLESRM